MKKDHAQHRPTIGYITYGVHDAAQMQWAGVVDAARLHDVNLVCFAGGVLTDQDHLWGQSNILYNLVTDQNLDGLIIWTSTLAKQAYLSERELQTFYTRYGSLPIVSIGKVIEGIPSFVMNSYPGMCELMEHLLEAHRYRKIAFLRGPTDHFPAQERYRAYRETLEAHGIPINPLLISQPLEWTVTTNDVAMALHLLFDERGLRPQTDIDVIVAASDSLLFKALPVLEARGICIPDEIAITGFDDVIEGRISTPPFTTLTAPYNEIGSQAVQTVLSMIEGHAVPDSVLVPSRFILRQSCGCLDPIVTQVGLAQEAETSLPFEVALTRARHQIITAMSNALETPVAGLRSDWAEELLDTFITAMQSGSSETFLRAYEHLLRQIIAADHDVLSWHNVISAMRRVMLPCFNKDSRETLLRAETLWQQARVMLAETALRAQMRQEFRQEQQARTLREISQALITTFEIQGLMDILARELPRLGIPGAYLFLYDHPSSYRYPAPMPEQSRMMMAYNDRGRIALPAEGQAFPSQRLTPEKVDVLAQEQQMGLVAMPLYFQREQIGVVLFEIGPQTGNIYEVLRNEISSALQGALLVQRVQERSAEIARKNYILDTFIETVPDRIWFKDYEGRFTRANRAHALGLGLQDPAEEIGKTDRDFFGEVGTRNRLAEEQEILRTGQPMFNKEMSGIWPDGQRHWSLITKMPLRDEQGVIIGTFGISRDITELKHAQQQVEDAYAHIQRLNDRLSQENLRMGTELDVARRLQQMVLPRPEELMCIPGVDIVGYMAPAAEVGGDYYDVLPTQKGHVCIGIGDVTGHGLESGVLMLMTQTAIRTLIERGDTDPVTFLTTINRVMYHNIERMGLDRSMTLALVNYQDGRLRIIGQHEDALIVRRGGEVELVNTTHLGFPVGLVNDIRQWVAEATMTLASGDGLVLYTDGVTEAENAEHHLYGLERLCAVISRNWNGAAEQIKEAVVTDVRAFIGNAPIHDDMTVVVLKRQ